MVKVETEAPARWRKPPETANPSTLDKCASPRLYTFDSGGSNRLPPAGLEARPAVRPMQPRWPPRARGPLSQWLLQMEPDRAPPVQLPQRQLAGQAAGQLRDDPELHPQHDHPPRLGADGPPHHPPIRPRHPHQRRADGLHPDTARARWNYEFRPHETASPASPCASGSQEPAGIPAQLPPTTG